MDLEAANPERSDESLDLLAGVRMGGEHRPDRDQSAGVGAAVLRDEIVRLLGIPDDLRGDVIDKNGPLDAAMVEVVEEFLGGSGVRLELDPRPAMSNERPGPGVHLPDRIDVNMAVGDSHRGARTVVGYLARSRRTNRYPRARGFICGEAQRPACLVRFPLRPGRCRST